MKFSEDELLKLHKACFQNEKRVKSAKVVGCFECVNKFPANLITWWLDDCPARTAMCPICGTDAILPDDDEIRVTKDMLHQMNERWFSPEFDEGLPPYAALKTFAKFLID